MDTEVARADKSHKTTTATLVHAHQGLYKENSSELVL